MRTLLVVASLTIASGLTMAPSSLRVLTPFSSSRRSVLSATAEAGEVAQPLSAKPKKAELFATRPLNLGLSFGVLTPQLLLATLVFTCTLVFAKGQVAPAAAAAAAAAPKAAEVISLSEILAKASKKALGGGIAGLIAGVIQVITLMWLRTTMNYQYRYGTGTKEAMSTLWKQGGIGRFYQGLPYALMQAPLARFGDTAANTGVLTLFAALAPGVPIGVRTGCASAAGSLWRILITPIDTLKTTMQVQGKEAMGQLSVKIKKEGLMVLYQGAIANAVASFVGSYPWYFTFNAYAAAAATAPSTPHLPPSTPNLPPPTPNHPTHAHPVPSTPRLPPPTPTPCHPSQQTGCRRWFRRRRRAWWR